VISGGFTDVSGLAAQIQTTPYREGGCNEFEHQLAGPASYPPLVLRRGITDSDELWSWHDDVCNGTIERRNGSILLCGDAGPASGLRWNFIGAYPVKWNGPTLQAATPAVAVESIEIVHQGLSRDLA
jgi:phage tail-like protein